MQAQLSNTRDKSLGRPALLNGRRASAAAARLPARRTPRRIQCNSAPAKPETPLSSSSASLQLNSPPRVAAPSRLEPPVPLRRNALTPQQGCAIPRALPSPSRALAQVPTAPSDIVAAPAGERAANTIIHPPAVQPERARAHEMTSLTQDALATANALPMNPLVLEAPASADSRGLPFPCSWSRPLECAHHSASSTRRDAPAQETRRLCSARCAHNALIDPLLENPSQAGLHPSKAGARPVQQTP